MVLIILDFSHHLTYSIKLNYGLTFLILLPIVCVANLFIDSIFNCFLIQFYLILSFNFPIVFMPLFLMSVLHSYIFSPT